MKSMTGTFSTLAAILLIAAAHGRQPAAATNNLSYNANKNSI